jgi:hypothetical protein
MTTNLLVPLPLSVLVSTHCTFRWYESEAYPGPVSSTVRAKSRVTRMSLGKEERGAENRAACVGGGEGAEGVDEGGVLWRDVTGLDVHFNV